MILIDAVYINNSGGLVLLNYLIDTLESTNLKVYYLLDFRIKNKHSLIKKTNSTLYIQNNFIKRVFFYINNACNFKVILCFANIPPSFLVKNAKVYTYFHNMNYLTYQNNLSQKKNLIFKLKSTILSLHIPFSNYWIVQSSFVKQEMLLKFKNICAENILIMPFYPSLNNLKSINKENYSFLYVSTAFPYKNHKRLIKAFCLFYDKYKIGKLTLTITNDFHELYNEIILLQKNGYPIINLKYQTSEQLALIYKKSQFFIFPSLIESFGLGVVEAMENNCIIIGPDLPWIKAICIPSLIFNPLSIESIALSFENAIYGKYNDTVSLTNNKINDIVNLFNNEND